MITKKIISKDIIMFAKNENDYNKNLRAHLNMMYFEFKEEINLPKNRADLINYLKINIDNLDYDNEIEEYMANIYLKEILKRDLSRPGDKVWYCKYFGNKKAKELNLNIKLEAHNIVNFYKNPHLGKTKTLSLKKINIALSTSGFHNYKNGVNHIVINTDRTRGNSMIPFLITEETPLSLLEVVYHEIHHAVQNSENNLIDPTKYNQQKEILVAVEDYDYYVQNHSSFDFEREAHEQSYLELEKTIKNNPIFEKYKDLYNEIYEKKLKEKKVDKLKEKNAYIVDNVDIIVENNIVPLYEHSILLFEYDKTGFRKDLKTYIEEFKSVESFFERKTSKLYNQGEIDLEKYNEIINSFPKLYNYLMYKIISKLSKDEFIEILSNINENKHVEIIESITLEKERILENKRKNLEYFYDVEELKKNNKKFIKDYEKCCQYEEIVKGKIAINSKQI